MKKEIIDSLLAINSTEQDQLSTNKFIFEFSNQCIQFSHDKLSLSEKFSTSPGGFYISKHNRFAKCPTHKHDFFELNYMLRGHCTQRIKNKLISFNEGDILLLDKGSSHSISPLNSNDLLINIVLKEENLGYRYLVDLSKKNNLVFNFLFSKSKNKDENNHILFLNNKNEHIKEIVNRIVEIYFSDERYSEEIISLYILILITELLSAQEEITSYQRDYEENPLIIKVLQEIKKNYYSITLNGIAEELGYSRNYICKQVKKVTQCTFIQLVNREKIIQAQYQLMNSNDSIEKIMYDVGFSNKTYFYKVFKEIVGMSPLSYKVSQRVDLT